ncbi:MAG: 50S ribosomal protein L10 [Thermoleophilaceae bacterium]
MNRDEKAAVIDRVAEQIQQSEAIFALDYRGITVAQVAKLRADLREADATMRVVKNTLTERAADQAGAEDLKELLDGPTAFTFVRGDAALAAKVIATFRRENDLLEFKGGRMEGAALTAEQILAISRLPAREVLHGQLVGVLAHPISGLARTLNQLIQGLAVQLGQIAEQGLVGGDAPAAEPAAEVPAAEEAPAEDAASEPAAEEEPAAEAETAAEEPAAETEDADESAADTNQDDAPAEGDQDKE